MAGHAWGSGVVLCVTGLSTQKRQAVEDLITRAGGSYSPNLSKRCTHLLVASNCSDVSDKLDSALRNRHKWGLQLVSTAWLFACAEEGRLQPEGAYPAPLGERTPLAAKPANQAGPAAVATSGSRGSAIPESCWPQRTSQRAGALRPAQLPPSGSLRGASSFHTQLPRVKHSLQTAQEQQHQEHGSDAASVARGQGSRAAGRSQGLTLAPLPVVALPSAAADGDTGEEGAWGLEHLPLTQAGFMPTDDLLEQLQLGCAQGEAFSPLRGGPAIASARGSVSPEELQRPALPPAMAEPQWAAVLGGQGQLARAGAGAGALAAEALRSPPPKQQQQQGQLGRGVGAHVGFSGPATASCIGLQQRPGIALPTKPANQQIEDRAAAGQGPLPGRPPAPSDMGDLLARLQQVSCSAAFTPLPQRSTRGGQTQKCATAAAALLGAPALRSSADLAQQLQMLHAHHAVGSVPAGAGPIAASLSERAANPGEAQLGTGGQGGHQVAIEQQAHDLAAVGPERTQPHAGAQALHVSMAQRGAPSTAALLQQLQEADAPAGEWRHQQQQQEQQGRAHARHAQPDEEWRGLAAGGSPMEVSPAPLARPAPAAASHPLLGVAPRQTPAELRSPMQISPGPAQDTASLLQQLHTGCDGQQQQLVPCPLPAPLDTADLLSRLASPQRQQTPPTPSLNTAHLLQQLQQPPAAVTDSQPPAGYDTHALLQQLEAVAALPRTPIAPLDTAGLLGGLAGGAPPPQQQQQQQQPDSWGPHAHVASPWQQLHYQPPAVAEPGAVCQAPAAIDAAGLLRQLQQQQLAPAEAGAAGGPGTEYDLSSLLQQLQQQPASGAKPEIPDPVPCATHSLLEELGVAGVQQQPSFPTPLDAAALLAKLAEGTMGPAQQKPSLCAPLDTAALLGRLTEGALAAAQQQPSAPAPLDTSALLGRLAEGPMGVAPRSPALSSAALLQQLQQTAEGQPGVGAHAPAPYVIQAVLLQLQASAEQGTVAPASDGTTLQEPAAQPAMLTQQQPPFQAPSHVNPTSNPLPDIPPGPGQPAGVGDMQLSATGGAQRVRAQHQQRGWQQEAHAQGSPCAQPMPLAAGGRQQGSSGGGGDAGPNPYGTVASDSHSVDETVMDTCSSQQASAAGGEGRSVHCERPPRQQQGRLLTPAQLQWPAASQPTQPSPTLRTLVMEQEPGPPTVSQAPADEVDGWQKRSPAAATPLPAAPSATQVLAGPGSCGGGGSAVGSVNPAGDGGSQVADSEQGVFQGLVAILDPDLPDKEADRVTHALQQGGGRVMAGARLGQGATHVVCDPEAALKWLSMGLGIVSPQWVLRSLKAGCQQRCLTLSADTTRHLPQGRAPGQSYKLEESLAAGSNAGRLADGQLHSKEGREQMLLQLAAGPSAGQGHPASTPTSVLVGVTWSVTDRPSAATLGRPQHQAGPALPRQFGLLDVIPDSEEEEEEQFCFQPTQAAYQEVLASLDSQATGAGGDSEGGPGSGPPAGHAGAAQEQGRWREGRAWLGETVLQGVPSLTLLLPRDGRGELSHDTRCFALPERCTSAEELLVLVHGYYQEAVPTEEQLDLLRCNPSAQVVASVVRPAFLDLKPLARHQLLGARLSLEGLHKVTREPAGSIYELRLGC